MRKMNKRIVSVMIVVVFATAGCFHNRPDYPAAWPSHKVSGGDVEASIQGTYECRGEAMTGDKNTIETNISTFLFGEKDSTRTRGCSAFSIVRDKLGKLTVSATAGGEEVGTRILQIDKDYTTEGDWLHLKREGSLKSGDNVVGIGSGKDSLTTNAERDLIIKSEGVFMAIVLLIPVAGSDVIWVRFKRAESAPSEENRVAHPTN
jgi:hypothetical protein